MSTCLTCGGTGTIITCCDDICVGGGHCIHGDGEEMCPDCEGEGCINDDDDWWYPDDDREPTYSGFYNVVGDHFNIEAVCPGYMPECQWSFTWYRDEMGVAVVSGYDPENDPDVHWLCNCGHFETGGCCCTNCGHEPPWGCVGCGAQDDDYDEDMDFGDFDPYDLEMREPDFEPDFDEE